MPFIFNLCEFIRSILIEINQDLSVYKRRKQSFEL
jgi:hypothetical protein